MPEPGELERLLAICPKPGFRTVVLFANETGMMEEIFLYMKMFIWANDTSIYQIQRMGIAEMSCFHL